MLGTVLDRRELGPRKGALLTIAISLFALSCESEDLADTVGDVLADTELPAEIEDIGDVAVADPWIAQLDHSWIGAVDNGFVIAGYDKHDNVIGKLSVYQVGSNLVQITHEYPRPCDESVPQGTEDCADILHVTANVADDSADVWLSATPAGRFTDRAHTILAKLPPDTAEGKLRCALTVAASAAACISVPAHPITGGLACAYGATEALCSCREAFELAFPKIDFDEFCD
jgi:hypothetical protein